MALGAGKRGGAHPPVSLLQTFLHSDTSPPPVRFPLLRGGKQPSSTNWCGPPEPGQEIVELGVPLARQGNLQTLAHNPVRAPLARAGNCQVGGPLSQAG